MIHVISITELNVLCNTNVCYCCYLFNFYDMIAGTPTAGQSPRVSFDEFSEEELSCTASQYSGLSGDITFGWYREDNGVDLAIALDSRVTNSTNSDSGGRFTGKLKFASVKRSDRGLIKCMAFNKYGASDISSATSVNVKCESLW